MDGCSIFLIQQQCSKVRPDSHELLCSNSENSALKSICSTVSEGATFRHVESAQF
uniref:CHR907 n=1 Tax=Arundo donax TaxID=35708 RepID=A0A0A9E0N4_ARUDO